MGDGMAWFYCPADTDWNKKGLAQRKGWMEDSINTLNRSEREGRRTMISESNNYWYTKEDKKVTGDEGGEEDEGEESRRRSGREARHGDWLPVTSCWWYDGDRRLCETIEMT